MSKLLDSMTSNKWAMEPRYLQACAAYLLMRTHDRPLSENAESSFKRAFEDDGEPRVRTPSGPGYSIVDSVAVVPIGGTLYRYSSQINTRSGGRGASYEQVQNAIDGALANSKAKAILLHIDSPGGTVYGVEQTAMKIAQAKRVKPVHAFIDGLGASAAYWLASQTSRVTASPDAEVGSIGAYTVLYDTTKWHDQNGFKAHLVRDGANKGIGVDGVPISENDLKIIQDEVSGYGDLFRAAVVRGRPQLSSSIAALADGRVHLAHKAAAMGLIDGVSGSLRDAVASLGKSSQASLNASPAMGATARDRSARGGQGERVVMRIVK